MIRADGIVKQSLQGNKRKKKKKEQSNIKSSLKDLVNHSTPENFSAGGPQSPPNFLSSTLLRHGVAAGFCSDLVVIQVWFNPIATNPQLGVGEHVDIFEMGRVKEDEGVAEYMVGGEGQRGYGRGAGGCGDQR